jgi:hypothetical protein
VTGSYNSCAEREWPPSAAKQRRCRRTAERITAVSVTGVIAAYDASMVSRSAFSLSINFILQGSPIGRSREVLGLETVVGAQ